MNYILKVFENNFDVTTSTLPDDDSLIKGNVFISDNLQKIKLKQHQLLTLSYMEYIEKYKEIKLENDTFIRSNYGYICDIVGSGKSIIILALILNNVSILNNKKENLLDYYALPLNKLKPIKPNYLYSETFDERKIKNRQKLYSLSIIVVPHGIVNQWENYLKEFTKNTKYYVLKTIKNLENLDKDVTILENINILLVSASKFNQIIKYFENATISRLIIDEVDSITIPNCSQNIDSIFTWFISSSINHIRLGRSKHTGLICNVMKHNFYRMNKYILLKNNDLFIKKSMELKEPILKEIICYPKNLAGKILQGFIDEKIITMINANAINEVSNILNIKKINEKNIVDIVCKKLQIERNNKMIELEGIERMTYVCNNQKKNIIENKKKEIGEIDNKIRCIEKRIKDNYIDPITLEEIKNVVITKCCQNKFEMESILKCIRQNNKCPYCRKILHSEDIIIIDNTINNEEKIENNRKMDKYEQLEILLENKININEKILIFSEYNESFRKIEEILKNKNKNFELLKGTSQRIDNIVQLYHTTKLDILLLNAQYYGTGLNLINTDHIILFHKMNEDIENQVIGRAQRIGRNKPLYVWKLLHHNEN